MKTILAFLGGFLLAAGLISAPKLVEARSESILPAPAYRVTHAPTQMVTVTSSAGEKTVTTTPTPTEVYKGARPVDPRGVNPEMSLGLEGEARCWNCAPFAVKVRLTNYLPWLGGLSCWQWSKEYKYCMSETSSGMSWEEFYGFSAACPQEWPHGAWVQIPSVGSFICLDWGSEVVCGEDGVCVVDVLGPSGDWNQKTFDATLWVSFNPREE